MGLEHYLLCTRIRGAVMKLLGTLEEKGRRSQREAKAGSEWKFTGSAHAVRSTNSRAVTDHSLQFLESARAAGQAEAGHCSVHGCPPVWLASAQAPLFPGASELQGRWFSG